MNLTELTSTTTLLFMTIFSTGFFGNSLTIWNTRFLKDNIELLIIFQTPLQSTKMEFTLSTNNNLTQFLALLNNPSWILLTHLQESSHQFFCILSINSLDSTGIFRIRIFDKVKSPFSILAIQCITGLHIFQFHCTTYIAGIQLFYSYTICTSTGIDLSNAFLAAAISICQVITRLHATTHYLKVTYFTDMRFHARLEEINTFRTIRVRNNLLTASVMQFRHIINKRNNITQEFHQAVNAHRLTCTNTENREDATSNQTLADTFTHLIFSQALAFKEFLHQALVIFCSSFN